MCVSTFHNVVLISGMQVSVPLSLPSTYFSTKYVHSIFHVKFSPNRMKARYTHNTCMSLNLVFLGLSIVACVLAVCANFTCSDQSTLQLPMEINQVLIKFPSDHCSNVWLGQLGVASSNVLLLHLLVLKCQTREINSISCRLRFLILLSMCLALLLNVCNLLF